MIAAVFAKKLLRVPLVIHVRSLQRVQNRGIVSVWLSRVLKRHADAIVAIDDAVARSLPPDLPIQIIHNGMRVPLAPIFSEPTRKGPFRLGVIGVLHRAKGLYELVEAMKIIRERGIDVHLVIVGDNLRKLRGMSGWLLRRFDFARDVRVELSDLVRTYGLEKHVHFAGFVQDVDAVYRGLDGVCFPSHADAPGRPVFEAALYGLPAIVAMKDPTDDVIVDGQSGLCIDEPNPENIAAAIAALASDRVRARAMGAKARELAVGRFDSEVCAEKMLTLYRRVVSR